ncbi:hypothetical protein LY78DRAFT_281713 [Colletotrichum sublineola]|nr:hypothetical protein LY78DRAFT_281713 [Colletotrichum sublineola]
MLRICRHLLDTYPYHEVNCRGDGSRSLSLIELRRELATRWLLLSDETRRDLARCFQDPGAWAILTHSYSRTRHSRKLCMHVSILGGFGRAGVKQGVRLSERKTGARQPTNPR